MFEKKTYRPWDAGASGFGRPGADLGKVPGVGTCLVWPRFVEATFEFIDFNGLMLQPSRLHKSISYILPILHTCMQLSILDASLTCLRSTVSRYNSRAECPFAAWNA